MSVPNNNNNSKTPIVCPGHTRPLAEVCFHFVPDDQRTFLVSACHDSKPMLRDGTTGDWIGTFQGHKGAVWGCRLDPTGNLCATASGDFSVKVWDGVNGQCIWTFPHKHIVKTVDFSPDSKFLATGGHEGIVRVYDLTQPDQEPTKIDNSKVTITKLNWLDNGTIVGGCADGMLRVWSIKDGAVLKTLQVEAEVRDMQVSSLKSGQRILTVAAGETVSFFDLRTYQLLKAYKMPIHFKEEGGASLHPDGTKFVAGGSDLWVRVFDFATGKELECLKGHHGPIRCIRYNPTGTLYATGSEDGTIRLWKN